MAKQNGNNNKMKPNDIWFFFTSGSLLCDSYYLCVVRKQLSQRNKNRINDIGNHNNSNNWGNGSDDNEDGNDYYIIVANK